MEVFRRMNNYEEKFKRVLSGKPVGKITPVGNYGVDERGRPYYIISPEEKERKKKHAYATRDKRHFTFSHMEYIREVTQSLSNKYCGYILMLQPHIQYKTNILVEPGRPDVPLDINGIARVFGVQRRYAKETINKFEDMDILEHVKDEQYQINERYHFRKKAEVDVDMLVKTFQTAIKQLDMKPAELGIIYKLLPYVHYKSNLVCANPFEDDPKKVEFLNKTKISELVGISRQKTDGIINKLIAAGVIATVQRKSHIVPQEQESKADGRETVVLINPYIVTRMKGEPEDTLKQIFAF